MKKAKPRKPTLLRVSLWNDPWKLDEHAPFIVNLAKANGSYSAKEARNLAAWLTKAADWLEAKESES